MKNKTFLVWILITVLMFGIFSCTTFATKNTDTWLAYEIPPSMINYYGEKIMEAQLSDGSTFYVFYDKEINNDARFYYVILMQDFGWRLNDHIWSAPSNARNTSRGYMYVNPKRQVAVYFFPEGTYDVFKLNILEKAHKN